MSRLISDARRQQAQSKPAPGTAPETEHEPQFNPLAGARQQPSPAPIKRILIALSYLSLTAVLGWQGWLWWHNTQAQSDTIPVVINAPSTDTVSPLAITSAEPEPGNDTEQEPLDTSAGGLDSAEHSDNETPNISEEQLIVPPIASEPTAPGSGTATSEPDQQTAQDAEPVITAAPVDEPDAPPADERATPVDSQDVESTTAQDDRQAIARANDQAAGQTSPSSTAAPSDTATPSDTASATTTPSNTTPSTTATSFSSTQRTQTLASIRDQFQSGEREDALRRAAEHLRRDDHTDTRQLYARLLLRAGQADAARRVVQPDHNMAELELRAYADYQVGEYNSAVQHYNQLLRRSSSPQQEWYLWLAICYDNLDDVQQASGFYRTYLRQTSGQPDSLIRYARTRLEQFSGG